MDKPLNLNEAIYNLQTYLRALSFADDRITRPPLDGLFDSDTRKAVSDFQRTHALQPTGIADKETWDAIFNEYLRLIEKSNRPTTPNFFPTEPENYKAVLGESHPFISIVQIILKELSVIYDGFDEVEINGVFDETTENAIRIFQKASLLPVNGQVDIITWNRLTRDFFNHSPF